jgi:5-methylcytosine-specific restriction enzyme A
VTRRSTGFGRLTIEAAYLRCEGLCEGCGQELRGELHSPLGHTAHHRRPRRMGGSQLPDTSGIENALMLNADCHSWVESNRTWGYRHGFIVRQDELPAAIPVLLYAVRCAVNVEHPPQHGQLSYLTDDAGYRPVESVALPEVD